MLSIAPRAIAQNYEAVPKVEMLDRAQQIGAMIDMAYAVKNAIGQFERGRELPAYRAVSRRLMGCSILYSMLSKTPDKDRMQLELYSAAATVFSSTSGMLYPDPLDSYKNLYPQVKNELLALRASSDQSKMFYYLRNCKDFAKPDTIPAAIQELMLK
jgi:hypothetical protein